MNNKINIINLSDVIGGQEIYLFNVIKSISKIYNITLFVNARLLNEYNLKFEEKINVINIKKIKYSQFFKIKKIITNNSNKNEIFIFNGNRAIYLGFIMSYSYKKIGIQHSSILDIQDGELKKILRNLLYKRIVKNYNYLLGVSEKTIEPLKKYKNVYLLRNGIDTKEFKPINSDFKTKLKLSYGYKSHEKLIIMVGALNNNKGQLEALKVIKKLGPEYRLILVGNGPLEIEIKNEIEFNKISDKVKMLGHIKNVVNYYQISDILLFLSINEGLPLTILEAMATGLPIITTKVGGVPEVVRDKENGFFINRNYLDEVEFIIQDLLNSPIKIKQIEDNNIKKIKKNYSLEKCVEGLIGYIEKLQ